jgi:drug/metabolite transporter (DMT)-like permease
MAIWTMATQGTASLTRASPRAIAWTAFGGIACYYFGATWDFQALRLIDASVERVLLFSYPSIVVIIDAVLYRRLPHASMLGALIITYAGILMVVTGLDLQILKGNLAGAGLAPACAVTSAIYYVTGDPMVARHRQRRLYGIRAGRGNCVPHR